jgi:hypothetical protein
MCMRNVCLVRGRCLCRPPRQGSTTQLRRARAPGKRQLTRLCVHESVDDLCKKPASLCAGGEILGIAVAARAHARAATWENTIYALCIKGKPRSST